MVLEIIEPYFEVVNFILAIAIVFFGVYIFTKVRGDLKKTWTYFFVAIFLFGVHEIVGILNEFDIYVFEGLYTFTEFVYIIALLIAVFSFKGLLENLSRGKK